MTKPMVRIHNAETDEVIDREMTDEEFSDYQAALEARAALEAQREADAEAKASVLERLGITEEEAKLILG